MEAHPFTTVFDVGVSGFKNWEFPAIGLIFVAIGTVVFFAPAIIKRLGLPFFDFPSRRLTFFRWFFLGFAIFWTVTAFSATYFEHRRHRDLVATGACRTVEGRVTDFVPMPYSGHADESFSVSGVRFRYSDYSVSDAFNNASSHGGPIDKGSYVRICYDPSGNAILKLAIRDFKGPLKDYSRGDATFSDGAQNARGRDAFETPLDTGWIWFANLWVWLYFLDIAALLFMYRPLLRTYWRLKTIALDNTAVSVPPWLEPARRTKLHDTFAVWDAERSAIWLRARGLNFFRVPLGVAKLVVEERDHAISGVEIRFSSVMPLIFVLFLIAAYEMVSTTIPFPQAAIFLGFFVAMAVASVLLQRKRLTSRWEMLARAALGELADRSAPPQ